MNKSFVIIANAAWDSGGMGGNSSQQYARTLQRLGWDVAYVDPQGRWTHKPGRRLTRKNDMMVMCDFPYSSAAYKIFHDLIKQGVRSVCRIVDYWRSIDVANDYEPELEAEFVQLADKVYASSPMNVERLKPVRPDIELLRNGVDLTHFSNGHETPAPELMRGRLTLGVIASFWYSDWIELAPLLNYARNHPQNIVHLMGNTDRVLKKKDCPNNVLVHPAKHWSELPGYIRQFDVCAVPYNPRTTLYTNPIKVLEYLACGKPVVSCFNPSIADYPNVYFYKGAQDFAQTIERAVAQPIDAAALQRFLNEQTWENRVLTILN